MLTGPFLNPKRTWNPYDLDRTPFMCVCMVTRIARVWINRVRLPILLRVSWIRKMNISLSPFEPENFVSRDRFGSVPSRVSLLISIFRLNLMLTYGTPPEFRGDVHLFVLTAIRHQISPELSGHANAYRWRSLPRIRRHRTSKPQGSSKRVLSWQVTIHQLICGSLSHTHYWFEVGMMKVRTPFISYHNWCFATRKPHQSIVHTYERGNAMRQWLSRGWSDHGWW